MLYQILKKYYCALLNDIIEVLYTVNIYTIYIHVVILKDDIACHNLLYNI